MQETNIDLVEPTVPAQENETTESPKKTGLQDNLITLGEYVRDLSKELPKETFKRTPMRLAWSLLFSAMIGVSIWGVLTQDLNWMLKAALGVLMGMGLGANAFMAHEVIHGAIVKNRKLQNFIGFFGFAPYLISPTYWRFWHNNLHHGNTQLLYKDPDAFPTRMVWKKSAYMRAIYPLTPGAKTVASYFYFFYWFSFQAVLNQVYLRFGNKMWDKMDHKKVTIEFTIQAAMFLAFMGYVGPENWIWLVVIPFMVQNYTVMSYISTNHNISPYTKKNDPLVNSLTVTNHPLLEMLHLNFGYHTEHHLYPSMPMSNAKIVSKKLQELYPDRYRTMTKSDALKHLYKTPRLYKNRETLVDPHTGEEFPTI